MKKLFTLIVFVLSLLTQNVSAQNATSAQKHLKFKNVSITGKLSTVTKQLQAAGFTPIEAGRMKGIFANEKCELFISTTPKTKTVFQIAVVYDAAKSWNTLKSYYFRLKKQLKEKYNVQPNSVEKFKDPYYEGDGYELTATKVGKCAYISQFNLDDGDIVLAISDKSIAILYVDKVGETIHQKENNENALNDL